MAKTSACPEISQFKKLATGQLSSAEKEAVLDHLEGCTGCVQRVESLSEKDTLVDLIRQARTLGDGEPGETVSQLMERLRQIKPDGSSAPAAPSAIRLVCAGCGKNLRVRAELAGKKVKCPSCGQSLVVPKATGDDTGGQDQMRTVAPDAGLEAASPSPRVAAKDQETLPPVRKPDVTGHDAGEAPDSHLTDFLAPPQAADELGRLGDYRILKILGHGGMGVVFKAEDPKLKRTVAIKAMLPALAVSASAGKRFLREAQAMAAVEHDHIVRIYQVAEDRGVPFLAMEFLKGEPLDQRLKGEEPLPLTAVLRIGREIARALDAAHKTGLIHRDIKPANIWLEAPEERVKILDFGLARAATAEAGLTQQGAIIGTPSYMAPEQARGDNVDFRCDLFSLGVVLYRLCTGSLPFVGKDTVSTLMAVAMHEPPSPDTINADLPPELSELVMKLLEKDPQERPASAQIVAQALQKMEKTMGKHLALQETVLEHSDPYPASRLRRAPSERRSDKTKPRDVQPRRRAGAMVMIAVATGVAAVAILAAAGIFFWQTDNGTVRIEINDPSIEVAFDKDGPTIKGLGKDFKLTAGKHGLQIKRGDLDFHTDKLILKKGETTTLKIEWFEGKLQAFQDGQKIGEKIQVAEARPPLLEKMPIAIPPTSETGFVSLFNGKDLTGWTSEKGGAGNWKVVDGAITCSGPRDHLHTDRGDLGDFHLRAEVKVNEKGNSGIYFRARKPVVLVGDYEAQICTRPGQQKTGSLYGLVLVQEILVEPNTWFAYEIIAQGDRLRLLVNGNETAHFTENRPNRRHMGHIALQHHDNETAVFFRKIEIKELTPAKTAGLDSKNPMATDGFVSLFNGKDLTGWKSHPDNPGNWRVEDGILVGRGPKNNLLFSERGDYKDFHVRAECKINQGGNSGLMIRNAFTPKSHGDGYEIQIDASSHSNRTGTIYRGETALVAIKENVVPADTWFTLEVIARGNRLTAIVNGKPVADCTDETFKQGHLALQIFDPPSVVHFRKIAVKELSPSSNETGFVSLFNGTNLHGWFLDGGPQDAWHVEDGAIVCNGKGSAGRGWQLTERKYTDFIFRCKFQLGGDADCGIGFRAEPGERTGNMPIHLNVKLRRNPVQNVETGSLYYWLNTAAAPARRADLKAPGVWNDLEIEVRGQDLRVVVNGAEVQKLDLARYAKLDQVLGGGRRTSGHIGLGQHTGEGRFRDITIKDLSPKTGAQ